MQRLAQQALSQLNRTAYGEYSTEETTYGEPFSNNILEVVSNKKDNVRSCSEKQGRDLEKPGSAGSLHMDSPMEIADRNDSVESETTTYTFVYEYCNSTFKYSASKKTETDIQAAIDAQLAADIARSTALDSPMILYTTPKVLAYLREAGREVRPEARLTQGLCGLNATVPVKRPDASSWSSIAPKPHERKRGMRGRKIVRTESDEQGEGAGERVQVPHDAPPEADQVVMIMPDGSMGPVGGFEAISKYSSTLAIGNKTPAKPMGYVSTTGRFQCGVCKNRFDQKWALTTHITTYHDKRFNCEVCGQAFATRRDCNRHSKSHNNKLEKQYKCKCGVGTHRRDNFIRHMKRNLIGCAEVQAT